MERYDFTALEVESLLFSGDTEEVEFAVQLLKKDARLAHVLHRLQMAARILFLNQDLETILSYTGISLPCKNIYKELWAISKLKNITSLDVTYQELTGLNANAFLRDLQR